MDLLSVRVDKQKDSSCLLTGVCFPATRCAPVRGAPRGTLGKWTSAGVYVY